MKSKQLISVYQFYRQHRVTVLFVTVIVLLAITLRLLQPFFAKLGGSGITPRALYTLAIGNSPPMQSTNGWSYILLMGIGGGHHDGNDLTDSMLVLSIPQQSTGSAALISIPRDLWSPMINDKINAAYHHGNAKRTGGGLIMAKSAVEEVTGLPIHYGVVIDFSGFEKIIDAIGGIEVMVDEPFTDKKYPLEDREPADCNGKDEEDPCHYETISFITGLQQMDGSRALKFVRSRHAEGSEGTDYARSRRQQKILLAVKDKLKQTNWLINPAKMQELYGLVKQSIDTDLTITDGLFLLKNEKKYTGKSIASIALMETGPNGSLKGFFFNPPIEAYGGRWVLAKADNTFTDIHTYLQCKLLDPSCSMSLPDSTESPN